MKPQMAKSSVDPSCPKCSGTMVKRTGTYGEFYGCKSFPRCRGIVNIKGSKTTTTVTTVKTKMASNMLANLGKQRVTDLITGSDEQETIWKTVVDNPDGPHVIVNAGPGTGKSFSIIQLVLRLPSDMKIIILAFNKRIADAMNQQLLNNGIRNARACTYNSLGNSAVNKVYPNAGRPDKHKLNDLADHIMDECIDLHNHDKEQLNAIRTVMVQAVNLCRSFLLDIHNPSDLAWITDQYDLDADVIKVSKPVKGSTEKSNTEIALMLAPLLADEAYNCRETSRDFSEQIWLAVTENLQPDQCDLLCIDEAQDTDKAQLALALNACPTGRIIAVGDKFQSLYSFRGADIEAIDNIHKHLDTSDRGVINLPLTLTRRCPKSHVRLALGIYPDLRALDDAPEGTIRQCVDWRKAVDEMAGGDMVICRVNRYLIPIAYKLIRRGIKVVIRGREIGDNLISFVKKFRTQSVQELMVKVDDYRRDESAKLNLLGRKGSAKLENLYEKCDTLMELCDGMTTCDELIRRIDSLFSDRDEEGQTNLPVVLGSIHACKGLEAHRVYILAPELLPHPRSVSEREMITERNCAWVAATRSKFDMTHSGELIFVKGPDPKSTGNIPVIYNYNPPEPVTEIKG